MRLIAISLYYVRRPFVAIGGEFVGFLRKSVKELKTILAPMNRFHLVPRGNWRALHTFPAPESNQNSKFFGKTNSKTVIFIDYFVRELHSTMAKILKVIFLDIDGVLLPFPKDENSGSELFPASTLKPLQTLLQAADGAKLVLSSTWRVRKDFIQDIVDCIQGFGINFDGFFDITDPNMHSERQWEIERWLSNNQQKYDKIVWLALDDEELLEGDDNEKFRSLFEGHVIKTESRKGLTMDDVKDALNLWKKQLST